ncbi:ATP-binding protein [Peribacillus butanolivorans]|uniref:ATP-binding protein n=1 Tax=Peribacillus butanolivorans TaxID=421767 RepID=UPI003671F051
MSFQDQGRGIPEELLPRLGEPFYTLKEKGTGLGLMVCHKIIKQHDGSIYYKSKVNERTLVEITLPLAC